MDVENIAKLYRRVARLRRNVYDACKAHDIAVLQQDESTAHVRLVKQYADRVQTAYALARREEDRLRNALLHPTGGKVWTVIVSDAENTPRHYCVNAINANAAMVAVELAIQWIDGRTDYPLWRPLYVLRGTPQKYDPALNEIDNTWVAETTHKIKEIVTC